MNVELAREVVIEARRSMIGPDPSATSAARMSLTAQDS